MRKSLLMLLLLGISSSYALTAAESSNQESGVSIRNNLPQSINSATTNPQIVTVAEPIPIKKTKHKKIATKQAQQAMDAAMSAKMQEYLSGTQNYNANDGDTIDIAISSIEITRIKVNGVQIKKFYQSANYFTVTRDDPTNSVYLMPSHVDNNMIGSLSSGVGPITNAFITDENGNTYNLRIKIYDIPAQTIVINNKSQKGKQFSKSNEPYTRKIMSLIQSMFMDDVNSGYDISSPNEKLRLWKDTDFVLVRSFKDADFIGYSYSLTNTGTSQMRFSETEFTQRGTLAVSIQDLVLDPGQKTRVFVVNENLSGE